MIDVLRYINPDGKDLVGEWLNRLRDEKARAKVMVRIDRVQVGNFGDCKALGNGLHELRVDWGPGYRVYFARIGRTTVLLLCGGDKRTQTSDIVRARECLEDYKRRSAER